MKVLVGGKLWEAQLQPEPLRLRPLRLSAADRFFQSVADNVVNCVLAFLEGKEWLTLEITSKATLTATQRSGCWHVRSGLGSLGCRLGRDVLTPSAARYASVQYLLAEARVRTAWHSLYAWQSGTLKAALAPGLDHPAINALEQQLEAGALPAEIRASYAVHNGQVSRLPWQGVLDGTMYLSLEEVVAESCESDASWLHRDLQGGLLLPLSVAQGRATVAVSLIDGCVYSLMPLSTKLVANSWSEFLMLR